MKEINEESERVEEIKKLKQYWERKRTTKRKIHRERDREYRK